MSKKDKIIKRFLSQPKDFTWDELVSLLTSFGYELSNAGKTSGSAVKFRHAKYGEIRLHKPHPAKIIKPYLIKDIIEKFRRDGLI